MTILSQDKKYFLICQIARMLSVYKPSLDKIIMSSMRSKAGVSPPSLLPYSPKRHQGRAKNLIHFQQHGLPVPQVL